MAGKFKPTSPGVSPAAAGQAPASSQGTDPKPPIESETNPMGDPNDSSAEATISDLRAQLSAAQSNAAVSAGKIKELEDANQSRLTLDADKAKELLDARATIGTQASQIASLTESVELLKKENLAHAGTIAELNKAFAKAGTSTLSDLPEDCYQLNESAKIGVFLNKQIVGANANKDDVLIVGDEADVEHYAPKLATGGRKMYAVKQEQMDELKKLGFLYPQ